MIKHETSARPTFNQLIPQVVQCTAYIQIIDGKAGQYIK